MTKLFRLRVKDGHVSPATKVTNLHGVDMANMIIPAAVAVAIMKQKIDWRDVKCCVAAGKDPTILLTKPEAIKPRQELTNAPDFNQETVVAAEVSAAEAQLASDQPVVGELARARAENRAPDLVKLTDAELNEQAELLGVKVANYSTHTGLMRAIAKKMESTGN